MRILIIGGTGLISTAITRMLYSRGDDVTLFNRGRSALYPAPEQVAVLYGDRTEYDAFGARVSGLGRWNCVIDMVGYRAEDGDSVVRAFAGRTDQYLFCSTVDVYRKPATRYPYVEDEPYGGLNDYSRNKVSIERTLWAAHQRGDLPLTIIRPAYTYGEGRGPIHSFGGETGYLDRIRKGKPIVVHGDGSSLWVACHRDDVARAFTAAAGNPATLGRSYHAAGEEWMTWNDYHRIVARALAAPTPELVHIPTDLLARVAPKARICLENFQFNNIFDNTAARRDLDFRYTVIWEEGVRRMADWLDARGKVEDSDLDPSEDRLIAAWARLGDALAAA